MTDFGDIGESVEPTVDEPVIDQLDPFGLESQFPPGDTPLPADAPLQPDVTVPPDAVPLVEPPQLNDVPTVPADIQPADAPLQPGVTPPLPADTPPAPGDAPADTYTVKSGDTLWAIAEREYGDGSLCYRLAELNNIKDADLIFPDQVVTLFPEEALTEAGPGDTALPSPLPAPVDPTNADTPLVTPDLDPNPDGLQVPADMNPFPAPSPAPPVDPNNADTPPPIEDVNPNPDPIPGDDQANTPIPTGEDAELQTDPRGHLGNEEEWSEHWFMQAENGNCVPASVAQIVSEYTGQEITDETAFVEVAKENNMFIDGDNKNGMTIDDAAKLLNMSDVPATVQQGDMNTLAQFVNDDRGVMVYVDSGEYWNPAAETVEDNQLDHCVVVSDIDIARGVVYLSDPGHPDGDAMQVPIGQFEEAWADSQNSMIVCDEPSPNTGDQPASIEPTSVDSVMTANAAAIDQVTQQPWALLPIVLAVGGAAAGAFYIKRRRDADAGAGATADVKADTKSDSAVAGSPAEKQDSAAT